METFIYRRMIQFADTDMAGIAHFSSLLRMMEEAEHAFLRSRGMSVASERERDSVGWPRVNVQADFHSPARFQETLDVAVTIAEIAPKAVTYAFALTCDGRKIASGRFTAVYCKVEDGPNGRRLQSMEIPPEVVARLRGPAA
jgi:4-hydroxybenzoyl-CoA thioesterase/acyl-CoA thioester hydrolase